MYIPVGKLTDTIAKIAPFTAGERTIPGILFDISDDGLSICYSDNRKSLIEKVEARIEETDVRGKIVFDYEKLASIIAVCQPTGKVIVNEVQFVFKPNNMVIIRAEKMIAERDSEEAEPVLKVFSVFEQSIKWVPSDANIKVQILSRANYSRIFDCMNPDIWDKNELKNVLSRLSVEKGRTMYIQPSTNSAFVTNAAYAGVIIIDREAEKAELELQRANVTLNATENMLKATKKYSFAIALNTSVAKAISEIISKLDDSVEELYVHVEERKMCYIYVPDLSFGMGIEMAEPNLTGLNAIARYQEKKYMNYHITLNTEVFHNILAAAMAASKMDKTVIKFGPFSKNADMVALKITSTDTNASVKNDYEAVCSGCIDRDNNINTAELPISLKILNDIISMIGTDYVALDVDVSEDGRKVIRLSEVNLEWRFEAEDNVRKQNGYADYVELSKDEQMGIRNEYLPAKFYTVSANA